MMCQIALQATTSPHALRGRLALERSALGTWAAVFPNNQLCRGKVEHIVTKVEVNPLWQVFVDQHKKDPLCGCLRYGCAISITQDCASVLMEFAVTSSSLARNVLQNLEFTFYG